MRELDKLKKNFNMRAWLDEVGVAYATSGDNVTQGWVNLKCPYCGDHANHLGVNLRSRGFHCWLCGISGDALRLVQDLEGLSFGQAKARLEAFQDPVESGNDLGQGAKEPRGHTYLLPRGIEALGDKLPYVVEQYLNRRGFGLNIVKDYKLLWCGPGGEKPLRLIVPVYVGGRVVTWQAADVTGKARIKYESCPKERSLMNVKDVVYGIDDVAGAPLVAVVEGVTDRWRVGKGRCVALFGKEASAAQLLMLAEGIKRDALIVVMLDPDAHDAGRKLGDQLGGVFGRVKIVLLAEGGPDPGAMTEEQMEKELKEVIERG